MKFIYSEEWKFVGKEVSCQFVEVFSLTDIEIL